MGLRVLGVHPQTQRQYRMTKFEVWMEGYTGSSNSGRARLLNVVEAETFAEACERAISAKPLDQANFDRQKMTLWGSCLFDNEADARQKFG